jgi:SAM-dependent methyltransferase
MLSLRNAPDVVLYNGRIATQHADLPYVSALAVRGDRVLAIGTDAEIRALADDEGIAARAPRTPVTAGLSSTDARVRREAAVALARMDARDEAALLVPDASLDFVYIDACHHEPFISRDLELWWLKVRPGGVFAGHDFYDCRQHNFHCDVRSAVTRFAAARGIDIHATTACTSWWAMKPCSC